LIQLLLPVPGTGDHASAFARTREELIDRFHGVTAYERAPAQGVWIAPDGQKERDAMVMVEVVTDQFDRAWWRDYRKTLAARFGEEEIHIRALPVETP
jgi:hypothetical protein